jgi:hypothetical protein
MDIFAHALWTAGLAVPVRRRFRVRISLIWAIFWGVFPDVFSFAIPAAVRIWWYLSGTTRSLLPDPNGAQHFNWVWLLYYASHSLLVFVPAFGIAWLLARRPILEMLAWGLHILIDIPTHQGIFALHFLWPLSSYGFSGIRWENHWFLAANYAALSLLYLSMWTGARRRHPLSQPQS